MFTHEQIENLVQLSEVAKRYSADTAIIGAAALLCFIDLGRFTLDVDIVVALDLEDFVAFASELKKMGWTQERNREHRWRGPKHSIVDLMPAGPNLCAAGRIVWPESRFEMSLVGFEHVFSRLVSLPFSPDPRLKVVPPSVVTLLKIIAYIEDPHRRKKDLSDLSVLLQRYEDSSDRIFCDDVFAAELEDIEYANAFLLGLDVGAIATNEEAGIVKTFLRRHDISDEELRGFDRFHPEQRDSHRLHMQLRAFEKGFAAGRRGQS